MIGIASSGAFWATGLFPTHFRNQGMPGVFSDSEESGRLW